MYIFCLVIGTISFTYIATLISVLVNIEKYEGMESRDRLMEIALNSNNRKNNT